MSKIISFIITVWFFSTGVQAATVSLSPAASVVGVGDLFSMQLTGSDFSSGTLDGGGINISFDSAVLNVTTVTVDTDIWEFFSTDGVVDNVVGTVEGISFNSFQMRTGELFFATIEFTAVGAGVSGLVLSEYSANPFATGGSFYPDLILNQTATVEVSAVPVPAALWLFISGLGLLVKQRKN